MIHSLVDSKMFGNDLTRFNWQKSRKCREHVTGPGEVELFLIGEDGINRLIDNILRLKDGK